MSKRASISAFAVLYFLVQILISPIYSHAVQQSCEEKVSPSIAGEGKASSTRGRKRLVDFREYEPFRNILFLAEGLDQLDFPLATMVASHFPDKYIVRTGLDFPATPVLFSGRHRNLTVGYLDNIEPFPFPDNAFDGVVIRHGMCVCFDGSSCGGFNPTSIEIKRFLSEVARVLNKNYPKAKAVLHGGFGITKEIIDYWAKIAAEVESRYRVAITFHFADDGSIEPNPEFFFQISIVPRP